jgi:hypothetical protein
MVESDLFAQLKELDHRLQLAQQLRTTLVNDARRTLSKVHQTTTNPKESIDRVVQMNVNNSFATEARTVGGYWFA